MHRAPTTVHDLTQQRLEIWNFPEPTPRNHYTVAIQYFAGIPAVENLEALARTGEPLLGMPSEPFLARLRPCSIWPPDHAVQRHLHDLGHVVNPPLYEWRAEASFDAPEPHCASIQENWTKHPFGN